MFRELAARQDVVQSLIGWVANAGLLTHSLQQILTVDLGFSRDGVVIAMFTTRPGVKQRPDDAVYRPALIDRVEAMPEVRRASVAQFPPGSPGFRQIVSPMSWEPTEGLSAVLIP